MAEPSAGNAAPAADPAFTGLAEPGRGLEGPAPLRLRALPLCRRLILRGGEAVRRRAGETLGLTLPGQAHGNVLGGEVEALWLEPDAWLLQQEPGHAGDLAGALRTALDGLPHALVEVGERYVGLTLAGAEAMAVLAAGCALDLHPRSFPTSTVTRTLIGGAEVVLLRRDDAPTFQILTGRSFAAYSCRFLENAAREHGYRWIA